VDARLTCLAAHHLGLKVFGTLPCSNRVSGKEQEGVPHVNRLQRQLGLLGRRSKLLACRGYRYSVCSPWTHRAAL